MGTPITSSFTRFSFTGDEEIAARVLHFTQEQLIQNDMAIIAEQIINLEYTPEDPAKFLQQDAYLKGQLSIYRVLLEQSREAAALIIKMQQSNQFNN